MKNQEIFCKECAGFLTFIGAECSVHEAVSKLMYAERSHVCGEHPRSHSVNREVQKKWTAHLAAAPPMTGPEYLDEQLRFCWDEIGQLTFAQTLARCGFPPTP